MRTLKLTVLIAFLFTHAVLGQANSTPTQTGSPTANPTETRTPSVTPTIPPTPEPTIEGFAVSGSGEVIFPEALRFTVRLSRPLTEIREARLTIGTEVQPAFVPEFQLEDIAQETEPEVFLAYNWTLPEDAIPPLFSEVEFVWDVEARDGETARLEGVVEFTDQRVVWLENALMDDKLIVTASRDIPVGLMQNLEMVYERLSDNTGLSPELRFLIYDSSIAPGCITRTLDDGTEETVAVAPFSGATVFCRPGFAEQVYATGNVAVYQRAPGSDTESAMVEYMAGEFYDLLWAESVVPDWFKVGLQMFYTPALKTELLPVVQTMARNNRLFSLDAMNNIPSGDAQLVELWRAQSYGMVLYIAEQVGVDGLFELAADSGDGAVFSELYTEMTGESVQALIPAWQGWIFTRRAELVYGITPYQPPTRTYTPTLTDTATRLPTATLTPSLTFTASVTGALSPTPYPTLTSSMTPTPEPPTVTPRSLPRTPTPVPTSPIAALSAPGVQAGLIIVLLIVIGILVYAYIRLGRR